MAHTLTIVETNLPMLQNVSNILIYDMWLIHLYEVICSLNFILSWSPHLILRVPLLFFLVGKDDNVKANLKQYNLDNEYIDMLVSDASRSVWRSTELFDAIVTDRK